MRATLPTDLLVRLMNASPEQFAAVELILGLGAGASDGGLKPHKRADTKVPMPHPQPRLSITTEGEHAGDDAIHRVGRLAYRNDFADVWLGEQHFDLRRRAKARACIRYLVEKRAFGIESACHLVEEIDPFVRAQCQLPELPGYGEIKIHHYFNPCTSDVARLGRELIEPAGRNGRYFLKVN